MKIEDKIKNLKKEIAEEIYNNLKEKGKDEVEIAAVIYDVNGALRTQLVWKVQISEKGLLFFVKDFCVPLKYEKILVEDLFFIEEEVKRKLMEEKNERKI